VKLPAAGPNPPMLLNFTKESTMFVVVILEMEMVTAAKTKVKKVVFGFLEDVDAHAYADKINAETGDVAEVHVAEAWCEKCVPIVTID
jgi:hypothetical protein